MIVNVHVEMDRIHGKQVVGGEHDEHQIGSIISEKEILKEHAKHFLDKVEAVISVH